MDVYAAPKAKLVSSAQPLPSVRRRLLLLPVFAAAGLLSSAVAFIACRLVPIAGYASIMALALIAAVAGAAFLWHPLARTYGRHAFRAGALVGAVPAGLRVWSLQRWPDSTASQAVALVDTLGVVLAFAVGAAVLARRLGANNSSKPTPLRGAA